jgi:DNA oxidative demethylase
MTEPRRRATGRAGQESLWPADEPPAPEGLAYHPEFLTGAEEAQLLAVIEGLDFREVVMRGQVARRTVRHFGLDYGYGRGDVVPTDAFPAPLLWLRDRCAALMGREPEALEQILVSRYPAGAGIGWHRDAPMFGSSIAGVSLRAHCRMRFQRTLKDQPRETYALELAPRSAYLMAGPARWSWQHSIPPGNELRYSVTFRTMKRGRASAPAAGRGRLG